MFMNLINQHIGILEGYAELWQADLLEVRTDAKKNRGYQYILVEIDCYYRSMWTEPSNSETSEKVAKGLKITSTWPSIHQRIYNQIMEPISATIFSAG